jgi:hypothetical protein
VWLESWNEKVAVDFPQAPTPELFMEAMETMLMKADIE